MTQQRSRRRMRVGAGLVVGCAVVGILASSPASALEEALDGGMPEAVMVAQSAPPMPEAVMVAQSAPPMPEAVMVAQSAPAMPEAVMVAQSAPAMPETAPAIVSARAAVAASRPAQVLPATGPSGGADPMLALLATSMVLSGGAMAWVGRQRFAIAT